MWTFGKRKKQVGYISKKVQEPRLSPFVWQSIFGVCVLLLCVVCIVAVWYITHIERFQVNSVEVVGGTTISHDRIRTSVEAVLSGAYLRLIPRKFIPTYPHAEIEETLKTIPRIKNIHVEHVSGKKLVVAFDEYVPSALWCSAENSKECLFIDTEGFAFGVAPALEGNAFIRFIDDVKKPELNAHMGESAFLKSATTLAELMRTRLDLYVTHIEKKSEFDTLYTIVGGGVIKTSQKDAPEKIFENLETILASKEFVHIAPGDFEYIDLRFGDKVFVREVPVVATSSASSSTSLNE